MSSLTTLARPYAKAAFELARSRSGRLCSVDKSNVMRFVGGLWRRVFEEVGAAYPQIEADAMYVDAMAMIRKSVWREVGGYVTDPAMELGWEDYDLWLNFASHGYRGVHVREIVAAAEEGADLLLVASGDCEQFVVSLQFVVAALVNVFNAQRFGPGGDHG